jgi:hypothetical protein
MHTKTYGHYPRIIPESASFRLKYDNSEVLILSPHQTAYFTCRNLLDTARCMLYHNPWNWKYMKDYVSLLYVLLLLLLPDFFYHAWRNNPMIFPEKNRTVNFVRTGLTLSQAGLGRDASIVGCCFFTAECCDYWERTIAYRWLAITYPRVACSSSCLLLVIAHHPPLMRAHALIQSSCGNHLTAVFCSPTWDHGVPQDPWPDINRVISDNCPEVGGPHVSPVHLGHTIGSGNSKRWTVHTIAQPHLARRHSWFCPRPCWELSVPTWASADHQDWSEPSLHPATPTPATSR